MHLTNKTPGGDLMDFCDFIILYGIFSQIYWITMVIFYVTISTYLTKSIEDLSDRLCKEQGGAK